MRLSIVSCSLVVLAAATTAPSLRAQWVSYTDQTATRLVASSGLVANDAQEKDYAWGDLDKDGDIDLVIVRKQPFTSSGRFANVLLMNENGVLTDRSAQLTDSTVPGSSGFLDATNDRDVLIADVNGDTWDDVVTCTTLSAGLAQYLRVPRVYINRGNDVGGNWLGLLYDDALRIDDSGWGNNGEHRFCAVAAGDIDGDGDLDLYFGDYQQGGARSVDVNDRLMINDGTGYFTDESAARMTAVMLESSFGMQVDIVDMNGDGKLDIIKDDALNAPQGISISYNNTATEGVFGSYAFAYNNTPYHFDIGDLNNDSLPDMIVSDDGPDRYILNTTTNPNGVATFSPTMTFSYTGGGSDDGFAGNNLIVDLDNDGWNDAVIADVDVDISGCGRRCHIFRNLGNAPNVTLQEQIISGQVVGGITPADLQGTFDVAVFDIDGDGWKDLVIGRCGGTKIWMSEPPDSLTLSYGGTLPSLITPGVPAMITVTATGLGGVTPVPGTGVVNYSVNNAPFQSAAMADGAPGQYVAALPALSCADDVRFYFSVDASNATTVTDPPTAPAGFYSATSAVGTAVLYENNFEVNSAGWTVQNTALSRGAWERADPIGTNNGAAFAAPDDDAEAGSATFAFVTENGLPGGSAGVADVDGGPTDLISPPIDFAGTDGFISYQRWMYSSTDDVMVVSVSGNGASWVTVETVDGSNNMWLAHQFRVGDYITPTATVQVRFRVSDNPNNSITEAGIDVFRAEVFTCDYCQPTYPLTTIGPATLSMCGGDLSPGTSTTLAIEGMPAFTTGLLLFDVFPFPTAWNGGQLISPAPVILGTTFADSNGDFIVPLAIGGLLPAGWQLYVQSVYTDNSLPLQVGITNALQVTWN